MTLDRLTVRDGRLADPDGRTAVLRGFVTVTADQRGPCELSESNYDQLASWGCNAQVIRLEGARLGVLGSQFDPSYPDKLDRWTSWAAQRGIHTMFKMTTYDVAALGVGRAFDPEVWQSFWDRDDWRADRIDAWRTVWNRFAGRPEVVGYDVLNEPFLGRMSADEATGRAYAFYADCSRALREVDADALLMVQPVLGGMGHGSVAQRRVDDPLVAFAPHLYPDLFAECSRADYVREIEVFERAADEVGGALIIGEYGLPNVPFPLGRRTVRTADDSHLDGTAFARDARAASAIRPWYVDAGPWAVCERGWTPKPIAGSIVRPYLARIPGTAVWSYDAAARTLQATVESTGGALDVVAPRHVYPGGVRVTVDGARSNAAVGAVHMRLAAGRNEVTLEPA